MNKLSIQQICHINKPVYIWGARALGCGVLRLAQRKKLNIRGFIDSDTAFKDQNILGYHVYPATHLKEIVISEKPYVIIASSANERTIGRLCEQMGMRKFFDFCTSSDICGVEYVIDIVGACNLACPSCPRGNYHIHPPKGIMSLNKYEKVVEKILEESPNVSAISLFNWGEPLLHPQLQDIITIQRNKKIFSSVSTNFNIKDIENLVNIKFDMLKVSVSGYFQKNYGDTHFKGDINLVKANLYKLRYLMDKVNSEMEVEIIYHKYRNNTGIDLEKFRNLAQELGFTFAEIFAYYNPVEKVIDYLEGRVVDKDMQLIEELCISIDEATISNTEKAEKRVCSLRENQIVINWNGSVSLCCACYDPKKTIIADDFLDISLNEILSLKHKNTLCKTCMEYGIDQYYFDTSQRKVEKS